MTATTAERWADVLDGIERNVTACAQRFLRGDAVETPLPAPPPSDLGPLPSHLEARACAVLDALREVQSKLERVPRPRGEPGRTRFSGRSAGVVTFDRTI
jgi:hypothetical protein